jgi:HK97 family phage major capsid protein
MALKELQERFVAVNSELKALFAKPSMTADESAKTDTLLEEGAGLQSQIERAKKAEDLESWGRKAMPMLPMTSPTATVESLKAAGNTHIENKPEGFLVNESGEALIDAKTMAIISAPEYKSAFREYLRKGQNGLKSASIKVLEEGLDTAGGFLVPPDILNRLIAKEPAPRTVQAKVSRLTTGRDQLIIPRVVYTADNIYTSGMRVNWTGEVPAAATTSRVTDPVFGQASIPIFTAMMSLPLTNDMVEDSAYPIMQWITSKFEETIELLYENMILNGSGVSQPEGILTNANIVANTVNSGSAAALTADGLVNLAFALPEQYDNNATFVFNKTNTARQIALLKDGDGRYLWGAGLQDSGLSVPNLRGRDLLGYPVALNAFMPNIGANTVPVVFGDLGGYYLVNRVGMSIQVLRELYAETNQVLVLGRIRFGGLAVEDWKILCQTCHI